MAVLSSNEIKIKYVVDAEGLSKANSEWDKITKEEQEAVNKLKTYNKEVGDTGKKVENLGGQFGNLKELIAGAFTITAVVSFGKAVFDTTAKFEKLAAVLKNTLGSGSAANLALENIKEFAKQTPFSVEQITETFIKLANRGIKTTNNQLTNLGDLASALGKDMNQVVEAVLDVTSTERWNELGIKVKTNGDKISGTFKGVTVEVDRTEQGALKMIETFGQLEGVAGSMAAVSDTMGGKVNNLGDAWNNFLNKIGTLLKPILTEALNTTAEFMDNINNLFGGAKSDAERFAGSELATFKMAQSQMVNMTDDELDKFLANQRANLKKSQEELKTHTQIAGKYGAAQRAAMEIGFGFKELKDANKIIEQSNLDIADAKGKIAAAEEQIKIRTDNTLKTEQVMAAAKEKAKKDREQQAKDDEKIYQMKLKQLQVEKEILSLQAQLRGQGAQGAEKVYAENVYQLKKDYLGKVKNLNEQEVESARLNAQVKAKDFEDASRKELLTTKQAKIEIATEDDKLYDKRLANMKKWQKDYEKGLDDEVKAQKEAEERKEAIRNKAIELGQTIVNGAFDIYQAQLNNEMSSLQKRYDEEIRLADGNKQKITEINERKAAEEREIKLKQFRAEQLSAVANIWFAAAPQIVSYGANPATIPLAILVASIAAAQTGFVMAQPVPEFAEGTKGKPFKGGKAIVGERGVEKVITESGKVYFTPPTATLVDLPKGAQVIPNHALSKQELFLAGHYANRSNSTASPVVGEIRELGSIIRSLPITQLNMDERGFEKYIRTPRRTTKILNNRFRSSES